MKLLFATSELYPLIKTGGLADVSQALPRALQDIGVEVTLVLPGYRKVLALLGEPEAIHHLNDDFIFDDVRVSVHRTPDTDLPLLVVESPTLFDRPGGPYLNEQSADWHDNAIRFAQFCRVVTALLDPNAHDGGFRFDAVHANDWQTGLVPALVKLNRLPVTTLFTIHNLAYQGIFDAHIFNRLKLPDAWWHFERLEFHGNFSFLKAGIVFADQVTTVSPTYAREILQEPMGSGFAALLQHHRSKLTGILNGADYDIWNPATDRYLAAPYDAERLDNKRINKQALQQQMGLAVDSEMPLFGMVSRLAYQKGVDWLLQAITSLRGPSQWVILGAGESALEQSLLELSKIYPQQIAVRIGYDEQLSHQIEAGCDVFVMPSRYEPCGLNQLYSLRYGTLPLVHATGGLVDTVTHLQTGFVFDQPGAQALSAAIELAIATFTTDHRRWRKMQRTAMAQRFGWQRSAALYCELYKTLR